MEEGGAEPIDAAEVPDRDVRRRDRMAADAALRRRNRLVLLSLATVLVVVAALSWAALNVPRPAPPDTGRGGPAVAEYNATAVCIPAASVGQTARFCSWSAAGKTIRFFAVRGTDGEVRTAFDNAYCCYHKDLGERQDGAVMVCNMCGARYPIDDLNRLNLNATSVSQCCPADLPHTVAGSDVLMRKSDLEAGAYLFKA